MEKSDRLLQEGLSSLSIAKPVFVRRMPFVARNI